MSQETPQKNILNLIKYIQTRESRIVDFLGEKIIVNQNIFPVDSLFSYSSKIIAKRIPNNSGKILDVGTGTGVLAVISAKKGAKEVLAIDIDDNSIKNAQENIALHKLEKIIEIRKSDLFIDIKENEKFDLILVNLPLADLKCSCEYSHFLFDEDFKLHERLLRGAKTHLNSNGKILISSGEVANEEKLNELIQAFGYKIIKIEQESYQKLIWKLYIIGL